MNAKKVGDSQVSSLDWSEYVSDVLPLEFKPSDPIYSDLLSRGKVDPIPKKLQPAVDLRESWWDVGNQLMTNSCVGWAVAEVLRWKFVQAGLISKSEHLSVRQVWMAAKEVPSKHQPNTFIDGSGTSLRDGLEHVRRNGIVKDSILPFRFKADTCYLYRDRYSDFYQEAAKLKFDRFVYSNQQSEWRAMLVKHGPLITALNLDSEWSKSTKNKGVLKKYDAKSAGGSHCVVFVGYDTKGFIVRNSWGKGWGDGGFAYASNEYVKAAFRNAVAIFMPGEK